MTAPKWMRDAEAWQMEAERVGDWPQPHARRAPRGRRRGPRCPHSLDHWPIDCPCVAEAEMDHTEPPRWEP